MKRLVLITITTLLFFSCKKSNVDLISNDPVPPIAASTQLNVAYGTDPLQKMDIYLPPSRSTGSTKLLIMIHGGGWNSMDKTDLTQYVDTMRKRLPTYAIININYRLVTNTSNFFPTQENDVKAAVEFIYSKRNEYLISDKFVMLGVSAGAHLAMLQSYKYSSPVKIQAVINFFGPNNMTTMYTNPASIFAPASAISQLFNGATPTTDSLRYAQSSPINYINIQSSPTIFFHGGTDLVVGVNQATALRAKLLMSAVPNQYVFYPTEGHGWGGANLIDSFDKIQAFLAQYVP